MIVGKLVEKACDDLLARIGAERGRGVPEAIRAWHRDRGDEPLGRALYEKPPNVVWDDATYRGDAYAAYGWAVYVAEVEVDLRTWTASVVDFVAVQEVGTILDDTLARGQVQGGVVQGIGWALLEECRLEDGAMTNHQLTNYIIPTSDDVPPIRVVFVENPWPGGPLGAKGLGELPIDGPAPAIANAIARAVAADACEIPITPERLMSLLEGARARVA
jgi:CO/xanthine dehydrogenase Mo-binding subunit